MSPVIIVIICISVVLVIVLAICSSKSNGAKIDLSTIRYMPQQLLTLGGQTPGGPVQRVFPYAERARIPSMLRSLNSDQILQLID